MKIIFYTYFFVCVSSFLCSQNTNERTSIKSLGMGEASVLTQGTISSLENLSSLTLIDSIEAGIIVKNNYLLKELNTLSAGLIYSGKSNSYGLHYVRFGTKNYNENKIGIVYSKQVHPFILFGARINYLLIDQQTYGKKSLLDFEIGLRAQINKKIDFATHLFNPLNLNVKSPNGELTSINSGIRAGVSLKESDLLINLELESSAVQPINLKTGLNWNVRRYLDLRFGTNYPNPKLSAGLGLKINKTTLDFYYSYHILLNHSSGIGINYAF